MYNYFMITLTQEQVGAASQTLALAFQQDPLFRSFFPSENSRAGFARLVFALQVRQGLMAAGAFATSAALEGVLIRLPAAQINPGLWTQLRIGGARLLLSIPTGTLLRMQRVEKALNALRRRNAPGDFSYLALLGVAPQQQGRGHAKRLLRAMLDELDEQGQACYLETENQKNVPLYQSFGFRLAEEALLPGSVPCWAMLRD
jgi:ribosomal protein S18 acetylase RimI-like enzyme